MSWAEQLWQIVREHQRQKLEAMLFLLSLLFLAHGLLDCANRLKLLQLMKSGCCSCQVRRGEPHLFHHLDLR